MPIFPMTATMELVRFGVLLGLVVIAFFSFCPLIFKSACVTRELVFFAMKKAANKYSWGVFGIREVHETL